MARKKAAAADKEKLTAAKAPAQDNGTPAKSNYTSPQDYVMRSWNSTSGVLDIAMGKISDAAKDIISQEAKDALSAGLGKEEAEKMLNDVRQRARLLSQIKTMAVLLDYMRNPEDLQKLTVGEMHKSIMPHFILLVSKVHEITGAPVEEIANPETRTEEQQQLLISLAKEEAAERRKTFFYSNFQQAINVLEEEEPRTKSAAEKADLCNYAALYFFTTRYGEIKPQEAQGLQESHVTALKEIYQSIDLHFSEKERAGDTRSKDDIFSDFVLFNNNQIYYEILSQMQLPAVRYINSTKIKTITDKLANVFFSAAAPLGGNYIDGQREMLPLKYEGNFRGKKSKKEITLFYDYVFNNETIQAYGLQKKFDDSEFFLISVLDNLYSEGNNLVSLTKIWHEMGNTGSPSTDHITTIANSIKKGISTTLTINDKQVREAWGYDVRKYHELVSPVMPVQMVSENFTANGKTADGMVKINGYSPFFLVAQPLGHITTWKKDILKLYDGRRTTRYYAVLHYLLREIGWMLNKGSTRSNKLSMQTIYNYVGDKKSRAQQLTKDMTYRLLDTVFIPSGYIKSYKEDPADGGILLFYDKHTQIADKEENPPIPR